MTSNDRMAKKDIVNKMNLRRWRFGSGRQRDTDELVIILKIDVQ